MDDRQDNASTHQQDEGAGPIPPQQDALHHEEEHDHHESEEHHDHHASENETQRLHRLVIPMILDILRSRGEHRHAPQRGLMDDWRAPSMSDDDEPPPLEESPSENMDVDEDSDGNRRRARRDAPEGGEGSMLTDQQGQLLPSPLAPPASSSSLPASSSPSSSPSLPRRPRYRLVVYFEERELMNEGREGESATDPLASSPSSSPVNEGEEASPSSTPSAPSPPSSSPQDRRPSRYVAIFSIDSDAHNMPIIHSAGLHTSPAASSFEDILNQLFTSYMPKGTPPAKKEIIDTLPTTKFSQDTCASQPKCAVCLEEFVEGAECVVLPCSHRFHGEECVKPWLRMHSSCPVCRYEMPVDDLEYEEKRKERMAKRAVAPTTVADVVDHTQQQDVAYEELPLL